MARNRDQWIVTAPDGSRYSLETKWTVSRGRDTYGYNVCTLYVNGKKVARCNGGGYDMTGTVLGTWLEGAFRDQLLKLDKEFYGLTFHDPNYDPGKSVIDGKTVEEREKEGRNISRAGALPGVLCSVE